MRITSFLAVLVTLGANSCNRSVLDTPKQSLVEVGLDDTSYVESFDEEVFASLSVEDLPRILEDDVNVNWVRDFEGFDTSAHYPGGASGPTISSGIDLAHVGKENVRMLFYGLVSDSTLEVLLSADNCYRECAKQWVTKTRMKISTIAARRAYHRAIQTFWKETKSTFPEVMHNNRDVRGIVLSLCYGHGPRNQKLSIIRQPLRDGDIVALAKAVDSLGKDHELRGFSNRRRTESFMLLASMKKAEVMYD